MGSFCTIAAVKLWESSVMLLLLCEGRTLLGVNNTWQADRQ